MNAVHKEPKPDFAAFGPLNVAEARQALGLPNQSLLMCSSSTCERIERFLLTLVYVFKLMGSGDAGHGGFVLVLTMAVPIVLAMCVIAVKPETTVLQRGFTVALIVTLGQGILFGAAVPMVYIPLMALVRGIDLQKTHPERPFGRHAPSIIGGLVNGMIILSLMTIMTPVDHWIWPYINVVFQVLPLSLLALSVFLFIVGRQKSVTTTKVSTVYEDNVLVSTLMYWYSMYYLWPTIKLWYRGESIIANDGEKLILWDILGVFLSYVYWVILDAIADHRLIFENTRPLHRVSPKAWVFGTIRSFIIAVIFGPGVVMDLYLAGREDAVTPVHSFIKEDLPKRKRA